METTKLTPTEDMIRRYLLNPTTSFWLKKALEDCQKRDIVDVLNDIEKLNKLMLVRYKETTEFFNKSMKQDRMA